jgi:hypothetical protein
MDNDIVLAIFVVIGVSVWVVGVVAMLASTTGPETNQEEDK